MTLGLAMGCTDTEIGARLTADELTRYMAYARLFPFGPESDDVRHARLMHLVATVSGNKMDEADFRVGRAAKSTADEFASGGWKDAKEAFKTMGKKT